MKFFAKAILIFFFALAAALPGAAAAAGCEAAQTLLVEDARLVILLDPMHARADMRLSGKATLRGSPPTSISAYMLCEASAGDMRFAGERLCDRFAGTNFLGTDQLRREGDALRFDVARRFATTDFMLGIAQGDTVCAPQLRADLRVADGLQIRTVEGTPSYLDRKRAVFDLIPSGNFAREQIRLNLEPIPVVEPVIRPGSELSRPKSWIGGGVVGAYVRLLIPLAPLAPIVLLLFAALARRAPPADPSAWKLARTAIAAALAIHCVGWMGVLAAMAGGQLSAGFVPGGLNPLASGMVDLLVPAVLLAVAAPFALVGWKRAESQPYWELPLVLGGGALLLLATVGFTLAVLLAEPAGWLGYEGPAILVSFAFALCAAFALRKLLGLNNRIAAGIAVLLALTLLFPTNSVILGSPSYSPPIWLNTRLWAQQTVATTLAHWLYLAALAGAAWRLVQSSTAAGQQTTHYWIGFLLLFEIGGFGVALPTNGVALALILFISPRWLFGSAKLYGKPAASAARKDDSFPWLVGGTAALISLVQFVFAAGKVSGNVDLAMLRLGGSMLPTFLSGFTAGLLLSHSQNVLRGDSAALKAVNISLLIIAASVASNLGMLADGRTFAAQSGAGVLVKMFADQLGLIAALILCAVFAYDLPKVKPGEEGFHWSNIFRGTTLAAALPIISAVVAATASAVSPIVNSMIGEAVKTVMTAPASGTAPSGEAAKEAGAEIGSEELPPEETDSP